MLSAAGPPRSAFHSLQRLPWAFSAYVGFTEDFLNADLCLVTPGVLPKPAGPQLGRVLDNMSLGTIGVSSAAQLVDDHNPVDLEVRLTLLDADPAWVRTLDGAAWPRSRSLTDELPSLITELHRRGLRIARVTYNPMLGIRRPIGSGPTGGSSGWAGSTALTGTC
jgi:hypothetical protein